MGFMSLVYIFRDFIVDGVPSSGRNKPKKSDIRSWGAWVESLLNAVGANSGTIFTLRSALFADLTKPANTMAWVVGDPTSAFNGIYMKVGAANTGSWTRVGDLPYSFIQAQNAGAGTANAIQATTTVPISGTALVVLPIAVDNTGSPVTVSFNGDAALTIKSNSGNDIVAGGLLSGMMVFGVVVGSTFRILNDQVSAAIVAAAEAAAADAVAAKDAALAAVPNAFPLTRAALKTYDTSTITSAYLKEIGREGQFVWKTGDFSAQISTDTREAVFIKANAVAATSGAWVRTVSGSIVPEWFGAAGDADPDVDGSGVDDTAAMQAWASYPYSNSKRFQKFYRIKQMLTFNAGDYVSGSGDKTGVDATDAAWASPHVMLCQGQLVALPKLSASPNLGDSTLGFTTAPNLKAGDAFVIYNPTDYSFSGYRAVYRAGEFCRAHKVTGALVEIMHTTYASYSAAALDVYKLVGKRSSFQDFRIKQAANGNDALYISCIDSPVVSHVRTGGSTYAGIALDRCVDIDVDGGAFQAPYGGGDHYGLVISNCQGGNIDGIFYAGKHAILLGGDGFPGCVPTRLLTINCPMLGSHGATSNQDLHGNTEDITFIGGKFFGGGQISGKNHKFIGCTFVGSGNSGIALYAGEPIGGTFQFVNCKFDSIINPNANNFGVIEAGGLGANVTENMWLQFSNCYLSAPSSTSYAITLGIDGTSRFISIAINGLVCSGGTFTQLVRRRKSSGSGNFGVNRAVNCDVPGLTGSSYFLTASGSPTVDKQVVDP